MDVRSLIVREYLASLKESDELDYVFPLFLESQGFIILSKPSEYKGMPQYGKDVVAVGVDFKDNVKKRFYFELKGGEDRHIDTNVYTKKDGVRESLLEAKDKDFDFINKEDEKLPLKIVLVHNGEIKASVESTFAGFVEKNFPTDGNVEFEHWGLSELTRLFSEHFVCHYLLADEKATQLFNKTLTNLNVFDGVSPFYIEMLDGILKDLNFDSVKKKLPRHIVKLFETLRLIAFVIYTESKNQYNNFDITKRYLTCLVLKLWHKILVCKAEQNPLVQRQYNKIWDFYNSVMVEYFKRTMPLATALDGFYSERGGRYEQVGYTFRVLEWLQYYTMFGGVNEEDQKPLMATMLYNIINANNVSSRPLIDNHSIPICLILNLYLYYNDIEKAKEYLTSVINSLYLGYLNGGRLPDARNNKKNVVKFVATGIKPYNYVDKTSLLMPMLLEWTVILEMEAEYLFLRDFAINNKIDLGLFIPFCSECETENYISRVGYDLEEELFSNIFFDEGYHSEVSLIKLLNSADRLSFEEFKEDLYNRKNEFKYTYRTDAAGYPMLKSLAHVYFQTPFFPDFWRWHLC